MGVVNKGFKGQCLLLCYLDPVGQPTCKKFFRCGCDPTGILPTHCPDFAVWVSDREGWRQDSRDQRGEEPAVNYTCHKCDCYCPGWDGTVGKQTTGASVQVAGDTLPNSTERTVTISGR